MDKDQLAALDRAAQEDTREPQIAIMRPTTHLLCIELLALYCTGKLVLIDDGAKRKFQLGDRVTKTKGSKWTGRVVGFYSTDLTPEGYAVESETEQGSVQIYPAAALSALGAK